METGEAVGGLGESNVVKTKGSQVIRGECVGGWEI